MLRRITGKPITINSGYRTPSYNTAIGGAKYSQHIEGTAADIVIENHTPEEVFKLAEYVGFNGRGLYDNFVHVDVRPNEAIWYG